MPASPSAARSSRAARTSSPTSSIATRTTRRSSPRRSATASSRGCSRLARSGCAFCRRSITASTTRTRSACRSSIGDETVRNGVGNNTVGENPVVNLNDDRTVQGSYTLLHLGSHRQRTEARVFDRELQLRAAGDHSHADGRRPHLSGTGHDSGLFPADRARQGAADRGQPDADARPPHGEGGRQRQQRLAGRRAVPEPAGHLHLRAGGAVPVRPEQSGVVPGAVQPGLLRRGRQQRAAARRMAPGALRAGRLEAAAEPDVEPRRALSGRDVGARPQQRRAAIRLRLGPGRQFEVGGPRRLRHLPQPGLQLGRRVRELQQRERLPHGDVRAGRCAVPAIPEHPARTGPAAGCRDTAGRRLSRGAGLRADASASAPNRATSRSATSARLAGACRRRST